MELYLITPPENDFLGQLEPVLSAGVDYFQYRRPNLVDRERDRELSEVRAVTGEYDVPLIVNDRPDLALASEADGVHLGDDDLPVEAVKDRWPDLTVGRTVRVGDPPYARADYLSLGPVFETSSKILNVDPVGWKGVEEFLDETRKPVYVIGGITPDRLEKAPGALDGAAVISYVWNHTNPPEAVRQLLRAMQG